jgi:4-hydroxy-3-polyprenylbenzoate decarboxylase
LFRFQNKKMPDREILRVILGISGASGAIFGLRLLGKLRDSKRAETHLICSRSGERTLYLETGTKIADLKPLAARYYPVEDVGAPPASGSFCADAMVVAPCSIHTMSAIASGISSNLLIRAADVTLKERRKLILLVRETPLHLGHLRTLAALAEMGAIIAPPIPAFYHLPRTIEDLVDHCLDRVLDLLGLPSDSARRWDGRAAAPQNE